MVGEMVAGGLDPDLMAAEAVDPMAVEAVEAVGVAEITARADGSNVSKICTTVS